MATGTRTVDLIDKLSFPLFALSIAAEYLALRFDIGEGFLDLGLVLTSLYFLGRQRWFPVAGVVTAAAGLLVALSAVVP